jgi:hypothetical protein
MRYITSVERLARKESLLEGITVALKIKFGTAGLELLPEIRRLEDHEKLGAVLDAIETAASPDDLRRLWTPGAERPGRADCQDAEKRRPFITTPERIGYEKGYLESLEAALEIKFGEAGLRFLPELRELHDHEVLRSVLHAIKTAASPDELRRIWAP